jgi:hypothetical protein
MKKKIYAFLAFMLLSLLVVPIVNLSSGKTSSKPQSIAWWDSSSLYNMDFALPLLGRVYYSLGISLSPEKVVIGKDGWFFLGDGFGNTISVKRVGATADSEALLDKVAESTKAWKAWLHKNGVKEYRVIIGPDKDTIYPELMPRWAAHAPTSLTDALMKKVDPDIYIFTKKALILGKGEFRIPLYYKADTHWNSLGAWIAFNQLPASLKNTQPDIVWPDKNASDSLSMADRPGGDLAKLQRIEDYFTDREVLLNTFSKKPIRIEQYDFLTGKLLYSGDNFNIGASKTPILVKSEKALNHKKVLWLRDSFGSAMAPFMAATFTETLQLHHSSATPELLANLVREYKPDYVLVTTVERDSLHEYFNSFPPMSISESRNQFLPVAHTSELRLNDFSADGEPGTYRVTGIDPYVVLKLSQPVQTAAVGQIAFDMSCTNNNSDKIPVQLFWRAQNADFIESNSVYFSANQGVTSIDISVNPAWNKSTEISEVRFDLVSPSECPTAKIKNLDLGVIQTPESSDVSGCRHAGQSARLHGRRDDARRDIVRAQTLERIACRPGEG